MNVMPSESRSQPPRRRAASPLAVFGAAAGLLALSGCASLNDAMGPSAGSDYQPSNIHRGGDALPTHLRRVVVLPLAADPAHASAEAGCRSLESILHAELIKGARFEVLPVSPARMKEWTGRSQWLASDRLPADFFVRLREETECDAVLFAQLTEYRAYAPLAVGWRLRLVDVEALQVWWAADELFDAGEAVIANSARRYHLAHASKPRSMSDPAEILNSPSRFGRYTASVLVATCPE